MFDKIRRSASRAVKRAVGDAVEDEAERQVDRQVDKARSKVQSDIDESVDKTVSSATKGMKVQKKITGSLITDFDKFKQSWEKKATEPEESVFHFLMAAYNYCKDPKIGEPMVTLILSKKHNQEDPSSPSGLRLGPTNKGLMNHMREDINIAKSYLGGNYKDDYKFDEKKLAMDLLVVKDEGKYANVIIQSGGKDNPTPVTLAKNKDNQWKITEFSSIATGCRKPSSKEDDF
ncbi:MAG: DUF6935 domain-containing protein [Candidatus Thorarchaeota archaeon]